MLSQVRTTLAISPMYTDDLVLTFFEGSLYLKFTQREPISELVAAGYGPPSELVVTLFRREIPIAANLLHGMKEPPACLTH